MVVLVLTVVVAVVVEVVVVEAVVETVVVVAVVVLVVILYLLKSSSMQDIRHVIYQIPLQCGDEIFASKSGESPQPWLSHIPSLPVELHQSLHWLLASPNRS